MAQEQSYINDQQEGLIDQNDDNEQTRDQQESNKQSNKKRSNGQSNKKNNDCEITLCCPSCLGCKCAMKGCRYGCYINLCFCNCGVGNSQCIII